MRLLRPVLLGFLLLALPACLILAGAWWWLNSYVKTDEFRVLMENRLGHTLLGPVTIGTIQFDYLHGVELAGISYHYDFRSYNATATLAITKIDCAYSWRELVQGRLTLTRLTLEQPHLLLQQTSPAVETLSPAPSINVSVPPVTVPSPSISNPSPGFTLQSVRVIDGTVSLLDETKAPLLDLKKIDLQIDTRHLTKEEALGKMQLGEINLPPQWKITDFATPFTYRHGSLLAQPYSATALGGNLAGDYTFSPPAPSTLNLNLKGGDVTKLTAALAAQVDLTGSLDLQSKWRALETGHLEGEGDLQIENGQLKGVPVLQQISDVLKIKELAAPTFTEAQSHFTLAGTQLRLTSLDLEGDNFSLAGDGTVGLSGNQALELNLVLTLHKEAMEQLPKLVASSFVKKEDGTGSISFRVTGTVNQPATDLPTRLLSQNTELQNVLSHALESFFHKREKKTEPASVPTPVLGNPPPAVTIPAVTNAPPPEPASTH